MSLNTNNLTTLDALKLRIGIPSGDTTNDVELTNYINEVSEFIESYVGRNLKAQAYTGELYQPSDEQELLLDNWPINSVTTLELGYIDNDGVFQVVRDDITYFIHRKKYSLVRPYGWLIEGGYSYNQNYGRYLSRVEFPSYSIRVAYNAGYSTVPSDIEGLAKDIIADLYIAKTTGSQGLKQYKIGDISMTWKDNLTPYQTSVLNRYRKVRF